MRWRLVGIAAVLSAVALGCTSPGVVRFPPGRGSVVGTAAPDVVGPLAMRGRDLVDATGRVVLIHGVNSVAKSEPFISPLTDGSLGPADLASMRADGINGVRLGVWAAELMPAPGVIDTAYLDAVQVDVNALTAAGMWVLLDFHQDVFWGMPTWATTAAAAAKPDVVSPLFSWVGWAASYTTDRSVQQWEDWWANTEITPGHGVQDLFAEGVAAVAGRFAASTNLVGIDLLNEPYAGSRFGDCISAGCPDRYREVAAMFSRLTAASQAAAPNVPVWWEPLTLGPSFPTVTAPGPGVGLSFHSYCLDTDGGQPVAPSPAAVALCDGLFGSTFDGADALSRRWDTPAMLTEFGASQSPLNATGAAREADAHLMSWFHWHGALNYPEVVRTQLVRTYAQATAGEPNLQRFEPATGAFELRYTPDHGVTAPTSIVVPAVQYPDGYDVAVSGGSVTSAANAGRLTVAADPGATEVVVHVTRTTT